MRLYSPLSAAKSDSQCYKSEDLKIIVVTRLCFAHYWLLICMNALMVDGCTQRLFCGAGSRLGRCYRGFVLHTDTGIEPSDRLWIETVQILLTLLVGMTRGGEGRMEAPVDMAVIVMVIVMAEGAIEDIMEAGVRSMDLEAVAAEAEAEGEDRGVLEGM